MHYQLRLRKATGRMCVPLLLKARPYMLDLLHASLEQAWHVHVP
jgi:hypothetical protein